VSVADKSLANGFLYGAVIFHSDWSTDTGTGNDARLDTDKVLPWDSTEAGVGTTPTSVIDATGLGFPTTNCLAMRIDNPFANYYGWCEIAGKWDAPAIGESLFYRWYVRNGVTDAGFGGTDWHPIVADRGGTYATPIGAWQNLFYVHASNATWRFVHHYLSETWPDDEWYGPWLDLNHTYRVESQVYRLGAATYNLHIKIYNEADALVAGDSDFANANASATLADTPTFTADPNTHLSLQEFSIGNNGPGDAVAATRYLYWGGVCLRTDDWCGPYAGGI